MNRFGLLTALAIGVQTLTASARAAPPGPPSTSILRQDPWNGDWTLSQTRNTADIKAAAADGYRFHLAPDGRIRWEIPSLHEVVEGRTDGRPMAIRRPGSHGLTLAVTREGETVLLYKVSLDNVVKGEGRMTLVDQGKAWVDISHPAARPDLAAAVIYVRPPAGAR